MKKFYCCFCFLLFLMPVWSQEYKIIPNDYESTHWFGYSVAIDGEYAIVGTRKDHTYGYGTGAAYIFKQEDSGWIQQVKLFADDEFTFDGDGYGYEVAMSGNIALVGDYVHDVPENNSGAVHVYFLEDNEWQFMSKIIPADNEAIDFFGAHISLHNDLALISSRGDDDVGENFGSAYVYQLVDSEWQQQAKFTPNPNTSKDYSYGEALAINDEFAVVGSYKDTTDGYEYSGTVYVYKKAGSEWIFDTQLSPETPFERAIFGRTVAIEDNRILVGAPGAEVDGVATGAAYMFENMDGKWVQTAVLTVPTAKESDNIGFHVSFSGQHAFISSTEQEGLAESGLVHWFREINGRWIFQQTIKASDNKPFSRYTFRGIDFSGNHLIVSAYSDHVIDFDDAGSAYIYDVCEFLSEGIDSLNYEITFYPNPTRGSIKINLPEACTQANAMVYDVRGSLVGKYVIIGDHLDLSNLPSALYMVQIQAPQNEYLLKVLKK
ncbi:MAG: T9SS type A sorting domain-containing protein [Bacteroidota bacterium]